MSGPRGPIDVESEFMSTASANTFIGLDAVGLGIRNGIEWLRHAWEAAVEGGARVLKSGGSKREFDSEYVSLTR